MRVWPGGGEVWPGGALSLRTCLRDGIHFAMAHGKGMALDVLQELLKVTWSVSARRAYGRVGRRSIGWLRTRTTCRPIIIAALHSSTSVVRVAAANLQRLGGGRGTLFSSPL
jgi:hypothetical protein